MRNGPLSSRALVGAAGLALALGTLAGCSGGAGDGPAPASPVQTPTSAGPSITDLGMVYINDISQDATWVIGAEPREPGADRPTPLVLMDRSSGEQTILCDWADEDLGFCSMAEQGAMIPETPTLYVEQVATSVVGWFPSGGVHLVDSASGSRTRIDTDSSGVPLEPSWEARDCEGGCDYHWAPRLNISADSVSGDGRIAAFCANYEQPEEPVLYVKDLGTGELTRTSVSCGINRFGREDDDDEFSDEGMSYPQVSADGSVVHVNGDRSTGGEYGKVGWAADTLYVPATGEARPVPGSGGMTRDGRTVFIRQGVQAEAPEADVVPEYAAYDVPTGEVTPLPWMQEFVSTPAMPSYPFDTFRQSSSDGRLVVNHESVRDVRSGSETDIGALLAQRGHVLSTGEGPLRISGDGSTVVATVLGPDPLAEGSTRVVLVTGWSRGGPLVPTTACREGTQPDQPGDPGQARPALTDWYTLAAMDPTGPRVVVLESAHVPEGAGSSMLQSTWTFDVCTNTWTDLGDASLPPPDGRPALHELVADPTQEDILGLPTELAPVWRYDPAIDGWAPVATSGGGSEGAWPTVAHDPDGDRLLAFDGNILAADPGATGVLALGRDSGAWTPVAAADPDGDRPVVRMDRYDAVYDSAAHRLVLVITPEGSAEDPARVWLFDPVSGAWSQGADVPMTLALGYPTGGWAMAFDPVTERTWLFSDTAMLGYDAAADAWTVAQRDDGWPVSMTLGGVEVDPMARLGSTMIADPINEQLVVLAGHVRVVGDPVGGFVRDAEDLPATDDIWAYDPVANAWTMLLAPSAEPASIGPG